MKILVFGGSFDPPHLGHSTLLNAAAAQLRPDRIILVPAWQSPFKGAAQASASQRLSMIRLGLRDRLPKNARKKCSIEKTELGLRRKVYTVETLRRLRKRHPKAELHFVTGSDAAADFESWKNPEELRRLARWVTGRRPGGGRPAKGFGILKGRFPKISSTDIRERLAWGMETKEFLDGNVKKIITKKELYGTGMFEMIRRRLTPERLHHSIAVSKLADELAKIHGLDAEKARLAGLAHDLGRAVSIENMASYALLNKIDAPLRDEIIRNFPLLLHAYIGADLARRILDIRDPEVLSAIRCHTLGSLRMSPLDRLLYIADCCSEDRIHPGSAALRTLARKNLPAAFKACVRAKIDHAGKSGGWRHPLTQRLWKSIRS